MSSLLLLECKNKYTEPGDLDIFDLIESSLIAPQNLSPVRRKRRLLTSELKGKTVSTIIIMHVIIEDYSLMPQSQQV